MIWLPLLFADGQPTSLERITRAQLEKFIPFMVGCCPDYLPGVKPPWWPPNVPFQFPLTICTYYTQQWVNQLKNIVSRCYTYHRCEHVLRFCTRLAAMSPNDIIMSDSANGLVNIYSTHDRKLIATFKKKNQVYDRVYDRQQQSPHKSLLPRKPFSEPKQDQQQHIEDIYLCNYCDEEFTSVKNAEAHDAICKGKAAVEKNQETTTIDQDFVMRLFGLCRSSCSSSTSQPPMSKRETSLRLSPRTYMSVPISSPLGAKMVANATPLEKKDKLECIQRMESFCTGFQVSWSDQSKVRRTRRYGFSNWHSMRRRNANIWTHVYSFNRKDRAERMLTIRTGLNKQARKLLSNCREAYVLVERLPLLDPVALHAAAAAARVRLQQEACTESYVEEAVPDVPPVNLNEHVPSTQTEPTCIISLCSSDEEEQEPSDTTDSFPLESKKINNNMDPQLKTADTVACNLFPVEPSRTHKKRRRLNHDLITGPHYGVSARSTLASEPLFMPDMAQEHEHAQIPAKSASQEWLGAFTSSVSVSPCDCNGVPCLCSTSSSQQLAALTARSITT